MAETVTYQDGAKECAGKLERPAAGGKRPGVLVVHEAPGISPHSFRRIKMLADLGYVALAADMYGADVTPGPEAVPNMNPLLEDRLAMRARVRAGLEALKALPDVDTSRIAVIGYCFGGTCVLELARSGAALNGVASFHGGLSAPIPAEQGAVKAKILACHGALDPTMPKDVVDGFLKEMNDAGADYQFIVYSGAVHSFTNRDAPDRPGFKYDPSADARSWAALQNFLAEIFA